MQSPLTTLTLLRFPTLSAPWAFMQMGLARRGVAGSMGLRFWKLLGAGDGQGFSLRPDLRRYGLLAVWDDDDAASAFFASSPTFASLRDRAEERWTVRLATASAHGAWSGRNPFLPVAPSLSPSRLPSQLPSPSPLAPIAVLTRATLRWRRLAAFWRAVPSTSKAIAGADGLLASIGVGEIPYLRQATFSLWRDEASMRAFAYGNAAHREVIRRTRAEGWYDEQLFARFSVRHSDGKWAGRDPLAG